MGSKRLALTMKKGQTMIEGLRGDISDFDNASHRHLVDQQFENGFVLMMIPLPSNGLSVPGERRR